MFCNISSDERIANQKVDAQFDGMGKRKKCLYVPNVDARTTDKNKV
jgi:hypothetical protein